MGVLRIRGDTNGPYFSLELFLPTLNYGDYFLLPSGSPGTISSLEDRILLRAGETKRVRILLRYF